MLRCLARQGLANWTVEGHRTDSLPAPRHRLHLRRDKKDPRRGDEDRGRRLFSAPAVAMVEVTDLEDVLAAGLVETARRIREHEALNYLLTDEPGVVLP